MSATGTTMKDGRQNAAGEQPSGLAPVIILNLFHSGLAIARQLAGTGVRVVGLSAHPRIYGNFTRLCEVRVAPNSQEEAPQLADYLLRVSSELGGAIIFPTRDADTLFLNRFREVLSPFYKLAIPDGHVLFRIMDKALLAETAQDAGIAVPRTVVVRDGAELQSQVEHVGFPCVIKPVSSIHWRSGNNWKEVGGRKAFRANDLLELQQEYSRISRVRSEILLQEWIPGETDQIVVWGGYVRRELDPLGYFTAKKIVQNPEEFGTGCVVESEEIADLLDPSVRLCRALGYEGIAEIEYKRDARDGNLKLIEVNARHWDWHQLGSASGVNLTWAAYCHLSGRPVQVLQTRIRRATWIAEDMFLAHIVASVSKGVNPWAMRRALTGTRMYGMFSWNDPVPFFRYAATTMLPSFTGAAFRKIRLSLFGHGVATATPPLHREASS